MVGAVLLLRRSAWEDVGGFDERFFLYAEETDWQRRAVARGWTSRLVPEAVATHRGAGSSASSERREQLFYAATETYIRKWFGPAGWAGYRSAAALGAAARAGLGSAPRRRARADPVFDVPGGAPPHRRTPSWPGRTSPTPAIASGGHRRPVGACRGVRASGRHPSR